ncbi:MAG: serine/threonine protein kinase [Polyangiaceae bacterium]|nr:serine/threonine protein kinase [Polyangiaceae bacterium]
MEQMGEYLVRRLIGEGGMGKVYEGEERLSKRRVALKVLHAELSKSDHARRLFLNEMQILARVEHPNIVRSLSSMEVAGELVMVLEFLDGRTLRQVIAERGRLGWVDAVAVVSSAANALAAAHGQEPPVIHRDLKPENIMVLNDGAIKVMDFGIAKVIEAMNQTNTQSVGTLQYMSPEQIDAHAIDHRSDLYCLGLILFELLEGRPPFVSSSPRQLLNLQCTAEPPGLSEDVRRGLPKGVEDLLFQLLEKAPEDRPYLAEDVVARLEPFIPAGGTSLGSGPARGGALSPRGRAGRDSLGAMESRERRGSAAAGYPSPPTTERASDDAMIAAVGAHAATPARDSGARRYSAAQAASAARPAGPTKPSEGPLPYSNNGRPSANPIAAIERADTIALLDKAESGREVPKLIAIAIIVVLSLVAGIVAYTIRATSAPSDEKAAPSANPTSKSKSRK